MVKKLVIIVALFLIIGLGAFYVWQGRQSAQIKRIDSFESCASAGYPILETYPEQCRTPDGRNFVREIAGSSSSPSSSPVSSVSPTPSNAGIANPASVYCEQHGGKSEIRTGLDGSQVGFCVFLDGTDCEEWAYIWGDCKH